MQGSRTEYPLKGPNVVACFVFVFSRGKWQDKLEKMSALAYASQALTFALYECLM